MKRSLHADEPANDWFSDALTPASLKKKPTPVMERLPPVEEEDPEQAMDPDKVSELAVHATLQQRYEQETT